MLRMSQVLFLSQKHCYISVDSKLKLTENENKIIIPDLSFCFVLTVKWAIKLREKWVKHLYRHKRGKKSYGGTSIQMNEKKTQVYCHIRSVQLSTAICF